MAIKDFMKKITVSLEMDTTDFDKELKKSTRRVDLFGKNISILSNRIATVFTGAITGVSFALKELATDLTVVGSQFEQSIATLGAIKGAEPADFKKFTKEARRLGATTAFTATQAAEGMQELARAGLQTNEILSVTDPALKFAGANAITMAHSTKLLAATMRQFGMESNRANEILDTFTTATQNSLFDVESLSVAMRYGGAVSASLGGNLQETVAVMSSFRDLGLEGSMVGTRFRQALLSLAAPTRKAAELLKLYNLEVKDLDVEALGLTQVIRNLGNAGLITAKHLSPIVSKRAAGSFATLAKRLQNTISLTEVESYATDRLNKSLDQLSEKDLKNIEDNLSLDGITKTIDKIDRLQIKMIENTGVTERTYEDMIDTVSGKYKILTSAIEETQIAMFKALNQDTPRVNFKQLQGDAYEINTIVPEPDTNVFYGFKEILEDIKSVYDEFAMAIESNSMAIGLYFTQLANIFKETFKLDSPTKALNAFIVKIVSISETIIRLSSYFEILLSLIFKFSESLMSIGTIAVFTSMAAVIRKLIRHGFQFLQQMSLIGSKMAYGVTQANTLLSTIKAKTAGLLPEIKQAQIETMKVDTSMENLLKHLQMISFQLTQILDKLNSVGVAGAKASSSLSFIKSGLPQTNLPSRTLSTQAIVGQTRPIQKNYQDGRSVFQRQNSNIGPQQLTGTKNYATMAASQGAMIASTQLIATKAVEQTTKAVGGLGSRVLGLGTILGRVFGGISNFIAGPWGLLITTLPLIYSLLQGLVGWFSKSTSAISDQASEMEHLNKMTEDYIVLQGELNDLATEKLTPIDIKESSERVKDLKQSLFSSGEINNSLLRELNITRDLTEQQKQNLTNSGDLLAVKVKIGDKEEEILLTQKAIRDLEKTKIGSESNLGQQRDEIIKSLKKEAVVYASQQTQLENLKTLQAQTKDITDKRGDEFTKNMINIIKMMKSLGLSVDDISKDYDGLTTSIQRVRRELSKGNKIQELATNVSKIHTDAIEKQGVAVKNLDKTRGRSSRRQSKLADIERKIARERLKIAAKRVNETKKLEMQFYIEDIRRQYDEEVKYFGKTRKALLKIERSYVNSLFTISATVQDKYFQELQKRKLEAIKQLDLLNAGSKEKIDIEYSSNIEKLKDEFEELRNVQDEILKSVIDASDRNLDIGLDTIGISKKGREAIKSDLDLMSQDIELFRQELDDGIKKLDSTYKSSELLNNPALQAQYESELDQLNKNFNETVDAYLTRDFLADPAFMNVQKLLKTKGKSKGILEEYFINTIKAKNDFSNANLRIDNVQNTEELALQKKASKEKEEIEKNTQKMILEIQEKAFKKYNLPVLRTEIDREQALERLQTEDATLKQMLEMQQAYNDLIDRVQTDLINESTRKQGEYTDKVVALQKKQVQLILPMFKKRFQKRIDYIEKVYAIEKEYEENLAKIKDSRATEEDYNAIVEKRKSLLNDVAKAEEIVNQRQSFILEEQKRFVKRANELAEKSGSEVNLKVGYNEEELENFSYFVKNSLEQKFAEGEIGKYAFQQLKQEIKSIASNEQVKTAEELFELSKKNLNVVREENQEKSSQLDKDKIALDLRNKKADKGEEDLKTQTELSLKMLKQAEILSYINAGAAVFVQVTKAGIQGFQMLIDVTKKGYESVKKVFDFMTGSKITFNVFDILNSGVEEFLNKEQEAIDAQQDLAEQLAKREITQQEYDEAISKGIGEVDNSAIAEKFITNLIDESVRFANAMKSQAGYLLMYFTRNVPKVFDAVVDALPMVIKAIGYYTPRLAKVLGNNLIRIFPIMLVGFRHFMIQFVQFTRETLLSSIPKIFGYLNKEIVLMGKFVVAKLPAFIKDVVKIVPSFNKFIKRTINTIGVLIPKILPAVVSLANSFYDILYSTLGSLIKNILKNALPLGKNLLQLVRNNAHSFIKELLDLNVGILNDVVPTMIKQILEYLPQLVTMAVDFATKIMVEIIKALPQLTMALISIIPVLFTEMIKLIPNLVRELIKGLKQGLTNIFEGIFGSLQKTEKERNDRRNKVGDFLKELGTLGFAETQSYGDTPSAIKAGTEGLLASFKAGDYVIAAQRPTDVLKQALDMFSTGINRMSMPQMQMPNMNSSSQPIDIAIIADGRLLDAVQVSALDRGQAPKMQRKLRRASGVNVGFNRGKFNRF